MRQRAAGSVCAPAHEPPLNFFAIHFVAHRHRIFRVHHASPRDHGLRQHIEAAAGRFRALLRVLALPNSLRRRAPRLAGQFAFSWRTSFADHPHRKRASLDAVYELRLPLIAQDVPRGGHWSYRAGDVAYGFRLRLVFAISRRRAAASVFVTLRSAVPSICGTLSTCITRWQLTGVKL
jgi:hypothetical protein